MVFTAVSPSAQLSVPVAASENGVNCGVAGSNDYEILVTFTKPYDILAPPITKVCVTYQRSGLDTSDRVCKILPIPSASADVCD